MLVERTLTNFQALGLWITSSIKEEEYNEKRKNTKTRDQEGDNKFDENDDKESDKEDSSKDKDGQKVG